MKTRTAWFARNRLARLCAALVLLAVSPAHGAEDEEERLRQAIERAQAEGQTRRAGAASNELGALLRGRGEDEEAEIRFRAAAEQGAPTVALKAAVNLAALTLERGDYAEFAQDFDALAARAEALPEDRDRAAVMAVLGRLAQRAPEELAKRLQEHMRTLNEAIAACPQETADAGRAAEPPASRTADAADALPALLALARAPALRACLERSLTFAPSKDGAHRLSQTQFRARLYAWDSLKKLAAGADDPAGRWRAAAYRAFGDAADVAGRSGDILTQSYALGYAGQLYERRRQWSDALALTRRAAFLAQSVGVPESLYLWHWQTGRLLRRLQDGPAAVAAYRRAVQTLQDLRRDLPKSYDERDARLYRDGSAIFSQLIDLLLTQAPADGASAQAYLKEARALLELSKTSELEDYFQDACDIEAKSKMARLDSEIPQTAILYPVLFDDRTEILLSLPDGLRRHTAALGKRDIEARVGALRTALEKRREDYLSYAKDLYDILLRPLVPAIQAAQVRTLVTVPDGALRMIPWGALHDGRGFLIERYALATTPGLTLTDLRETGRARAPTALLANGLSQAVQGFPALPSVSGEIRAIESESAGKTLLNENFVFDNLRNALKKEPYSIVHIASHGHFDRKSNNTFVLTYDGRLSVNQLENLLGLSKYRDEPVDLLVLSACQTAAGDDRAALGLGGIAIKAGARSALASLWQIGDESTALLMRRFYSMLAEHPEASKPEALRQAQLKLLREVPRYAHPFFWSPFLLIGNWH